MTSLLQLAKQLAALRQDINAYSEAGAVRKETMHRTGRRFVGLLGKELGLAPGKFTVRSNMGGIAVSGEVWLYADHLFIQLSESGAQWPGVEVLYRSCRSRADCTGGVNQWESARRLASGSVDAFKEHCRELMAEGAARSRAEGIRKLKEAPTATVAVSEQPGDVVEDDLVW